MYNNLHECSYPGSIHFAIPECRNLVTKDKIFCRSCFQSVTSEARNNWRLAFPYDVPYDIAVKDRKAEILRFAQCITFAKRQLSLFGRKDNEG